MESNECPRCLEVEDWGYIIKCKMIHEEQKEYITTIYNKLMKLVQSDEMMHQVMDLLHDVVYYFKELQNFRTLQAKLRVELLFKGFIVQSWDGNEELKYRALNKIVVQESIDYYYKCWLARNKLQNDATRQKEILIKWAIKSYN